MTEFEFDWKSQDGTLLKGTGYMPEGTPKAILPLVHGFGEHIQRYKHVGEQLSKSGIGLIGFDSRGHGRSEGKRGYTPAYRTLMVEINEFLSLLKEKFPDIPMFLYGHSMGGNKVLSYVLEVNPTFLKGVITTSPWITLSIPPPKIKAILGNIMANIYPAWTEEAELVEEHLSRDPEVGKKYAADPLVHGKMSAGLFSGVSKAGLDILENASKFHHNYLLMHGTSDQITSPDSSKAFFEKVSSKDKTIKLWAGERHELHNETNKEEVIDVLKDWVLERI